MTYNRDLLARFELPLVDAVEQMGREMATERGDEEVEDFFGYYGEATFMDYSIATYTEFRPDGRESLRAFARVIRVCADDIKRVEELFGCDGKDEYRDLMLCDTIVSVLARSQELAAGLYLLKPAATAEPGGPFYTNRKYVPLALDLDSEELDDFKRDALSYRWRHSPEANEAVVKLAGLFEVEPEELAKLVAIFDGCGYSEKHVRISVAHVILAVVRHQERFVTGLRLVNGLSRI